MKRIPILFALSLLLLAACTGSQPYPLKTPFDESQFTPYAQPGTGVILGQAFVKTPDGNLFLASGNEIFLFPVTDYTREWYEACVLPNRPSSRFDMRLAKYSRCVRADTEGRFRFMDLPPGDYYLATDITWSDAKGRQSVATAYAPVSLGYAQQINVVVTRP